MTSTAPRDDRTAESKRAKRVAVASLFVVWLAFDWPSLTGKILFPVDWEPRARTGSPGEVRQPINPLEGDAYTLYYPLRSYLGERLGDGDLPLWDPHRFAGLPFAANAQASVWYPPSWSFALGETTIIYSWILLLSRLGGLLLAYWFFRLLRLHPVASAAGATVFVFSGFLTAWGVHITFISSGMWLPLALGGVTLIFQGRPRFGVPAAAAGLGLAALGGHPQVMIYVWMAAAMWAAALAVGVIVEHRRAGPRAVASALLSPAGLTFLALGLGAGIAAVQLLGSLEFGSYTIRGVEVYELLIPAALPARQILTLLLPDRFGNPVDGNGLEPPNYTEAAMYVGIFTLVLVAVAVWSRRDRFTLGFVTIAVVSLLAAFGTGFYRILYEVVPGLDRVRGIGRIVFLLDTALAGLAALGLHELIARPRRWPVALASAGLLLGLVASVTVLNRGAIDPDYLRPRLIVAAIIVVVGAAISLIRWNPPLRPYVLGVPLLALIATDLWLFGYRYHPFQRQTDVYRSDPAIDRIESSTVRRARLIRVGQYWIQVNGALVHELYDVQGYDTFIPRRYVDLISLVEDQHENAQAFNVVYNLSDASLSRDPVVDVLGVRYVLAKKEAPGLGSRLVDGAYDVFDQPGALPPAFLVHCWTWVPEGTAIDNVARMSADELRTRVVLEAPADGEPGPTRTTGCEPAAEVLLETYEPERVVVSTVVDRAAVLVLSDTWDPGWRATVDGDEVPVLLADHALRGVRLSPGRHRVVFSFEPSWLAPGAVVSLSSLAVVVLWLVAPRGRLSRRNREPDGQDGT